MLQIQRFQCPYCGERIETMVDLSAGSQQLVEDCQVCCQPIEIRVQVDYAGRFSRLDVRMENE